MAGKRQDDRQNHDAAERFPKQHAVGAVARHRPARQHGGRRVTHGGEQSAKNADDKARKWNGALRRARGCRLAGDGHGGADHYDDGERKAQRGELLAEQRLGDEGDHDGRGVEQRGGARDARAGDPELVSDLEQRDHRAAQPAHQQQAFTVDLEHVAVKQHRPQREARGAEHQAPEADPGDGGAFGVELGGQGAGRAPHGACTEGAEIADDSARFVVVGHDAILPAVSSQRNTVMACPPRRTRSPASRSRSSPPRGDA